MSLRYVGRLPELECQAQLRFPAGRPVHVAAVRSALPLDRVASASGPARAATADGCGVVLAAAGCGVVLAAAALDPARLPPRWLAGRAPLTVAARAQLDLAYRKRTMSNTRTAPPSTTTVAGTRTSSATSPGR
ncbi:hypothetical protein [Actinoplanes sp. RD1]|uniref:hypothetical protein n=1 Tax=Actinoplanes sp. RD1 TaxID=3064538 RepID=UPI002740DC49|nr:hypothetical protein [Actinoplanes sp. RD1]